MNNAERLLLYTLPRWAGVTALSIKEPLSDMWLGGEEAAHHSGKPYDPDGFQELRMELRKDFRRAPVASAFGARGSIRTVGDLAAAMAEVPQTPVPPPSAMLSALLPSEELAVLSRERMHAAVFGAHVRRQNRRHGSAGSKPARNSRKDRHRPRRRSAP